MRLLRSWWCIGVLCGQALAADYPPVSAWEPDPAQRLLLRRSLTLLSSSTPERRHTVRVLFYGQSITQQAWWQEVARYLRATYPHANLIIENRAIGGHSSQLLVKTAEADLYPFQPDLVIFHVYGSHVEYENLLRGMRERTTADILLQTDHITRDDVLNGETDPQKLTPQKWDLWMNHVFLPRTAAKYHACRAEVHQEWKRYLAEHQLAPAKLLKDSVHLNAHGEWLMAELIKPYLAPITLVGDYDPYHEARVQTIEVSGRGTTNELTLEVEASRVDLVVGDTEGKPIRVSIDGKPPSAIPGLVQFGRASAFPQSDWPFLLRVRSVQPPIPETWSLTITNSSADGTTNGFFLVGSQTGFDGAGWSTNRFVSASGRVLIEPDDWNLAYCVTVFKRPVPNGFRGTFEAKLWGADIVEAPETPPGVERVSTVAQGLSPGRHQLKLRGEDIGRRIRAVRIYRPPLFPSL